MTGTKNQNTENMSTTWMQQEKCSHWLSQSLQFVQSIRNRGFTVQAKRRPRTLFGCEV